MVPQIVPAEVLYVGALQQVPPRCLETQRNVEDSSLGLADRVGGEFAPSDGPGQHTGKGEQIT